MFIPQRFWAIPLLCGPILLILLTKSAPSLVRLVPSATPLPSTKQASDRPMTASQQPQQPTSKSQVTTSLSPSPTPNLATPNPHHARETAPAQVPPDMEMRIALAKDAKTLLLATSTTGVIKDETGQSLKSLPAGIGFYTQPVGSRINIGAWKSPTSVWIEATDGGYVYVNKHWYRGKVRLINLGGTLLAVNHVYLEDYLYSVVGSEMWSNWPMEALKAQAVAARSYALARYIEPASPFYQMGATEAWQVYKGLDGEASSTHVAVNQTAGQFLSLKGAVVDAWYADTDQLVVKAHGGRGMSQHGACKLAREMGYDYSRILGFYYPGSGLTRLQIPSSPNPGGKDSSQTTRS